MNRWVSALRLEARLQVRQRFVHAAVISGMLWLVVLLPMPHGLRSIVEPYVLIGDITVVGFFFIGGSVFLEKQERTLGAVICSPLRFSEYLSVKIVVLSGVSLFIAVVVATATHGTHYRPGLLVAGVLLGTLVMLLVGFISALPFDSVSDWFLSTVVPLLILSLPVLHLLGVWTSPVLYLIPTQGPLLMFAAVFDQISLAPWQIGYAVGYPLLCAVGLYKLAGRMFGRYVIERSGVA
ncbi:fluoroquinolone transporter permease [Mycobacterium sp. NAZ190054]|uniref:fluoroquinolone export ABC transporter permease subunit n=1 Tax=Mycobacterium sp. NAZ190054 TaxID=1747766 RepID=UPI0007960764|nr:fluoroquinolone transporter permease [Mycobacterium sp. NAZ190054]KWX57902.1 fluoroquinolone transporter permease [Mycobacterium sp. NAZ190054]